MVMTVVMNMSMYVTVVLGEITAFVLHPLFPSKVGVDIRAVP